MLENDWHPKSSIHILAGAGSSVPFGFPDGKALLRKFRKAIHSALPREVENSSNKQFIEDIRASTHSSIDELLKFVHDSGNRVMLEYGRSFVEAEILRSQQAAIPKNSSTLVVPWLGKLLDGIGGQHTEYEDFMELVRPTSGAPALSIHTLNYDLLLEQSLLNYLNRRFQKRREQIIQHWVSAPQIYHPHGCISEPTAEGQVSEKNQNGIYFWWEKSPHPPDWPLSNAVLRARDVFATIGFGFHQSVTSRFNGGRGSMSLFCTDFCGQSHDTISSIGKQLNASEIVVTSGGDCAERLVDRMLDHFKRPEK